MDTSRIMKQIGIILILLTLTACARNQPWRTEMDPIVNGKNLCASSSSESLKEEKCIIEYITDKNEKDLYKLGFLEFTDRGNLFDNNARNKILSKIESDAAEGVLVIVYAHGWNYNAKFHDSNVKSFRKALSRISRIPEITRNRKVYGIYLGWRGRVWPWYFNHILTYWDRKSVAREIGDSGVSDILLKLDMIDKINDNNTLLIAGHSFGAQMLSSAVNEILLHRMIEKKYNKDKELEKFADGIVLVNPAVEANQFLQLYELSLDQDVRNDLGDRKLLTIITTKDDFPTRKLFPIGQFFNTLFTNQNKIDRDYFSEGKVSEFDLDLITVGQYKPFHTANLFGKKIADSNQSSNESNDKKYDLYFKDCCADPDKCDLSKDKTRFICEDKKLPISIIYTEESFIENHNDIFNNKLIAYLSAAASGNTLLRKKRNGVGNRGDMSFNPGSLWLVELTEQCTENKDFDFSKCFTFFYKKFCALSKGEEREICSKEVRLDGGMLIHNNDPSPFGIEDGVLLY